MNNFKPLNRAFRKSQNMIDKSKGAFNRGKNALNKGRDVFVQTVTKVKRRHSLLKQRLGLGFWILIILIFILGTIYFTLLENSLSYFINQWGLLGMFFGSFIVDLLVQPIGPDLILIFGVVLGFNPFIVLVSVLLGSYLTILVSYYIGKQIGGAGIEKIVGTINYKKIQDHPNYGKWILFLGAISPIPYIPYLAGIWKLKFKEVLLIIIIPRTIRFIIVWGLVYFFGTNIIDLF
jgi:membrane protein YqaA with SNARE-associated domain